MRVRLRESGCWAKRAGVDKVEYVDNLESLNLDFMLPKFLLL